MRTRAVIVTLAATLIAACSSSKQAANPVEPDSLRVVGDPMPDAVLRTVDNQPMALRSLYADRPVVITFYRGGWCPYCNKALEQWDGRMGDIQAAGAHFVAITPERPELVGNTVDKYDLDFPVYSDADGQAARALGIAFTLDDATQTKYRGYGIDLARSNANGSWDLPRPGTYIVDTKGIIRYAHTDPNYVDGRADPDEVIAALRAMR